MPEYLEITPDNYPNQYKLLKTMEVGVKYTFGELEVFSGIVIHTVKNLINFLRDTINFMFEGEVYHLSKRQIARNSFAYVLSQGVYNNDDFYFPVKKKLV